MPEATKYSEPAHRCHCCDGTDLKRKYTIQKPPSRMGFFETCGTCGVLNFFPTHTGEAYEETYYGEGPAKFQGMSGRIRDWSARSRAARAHRTVGKAGACLDIGCGDGDFLAAMQKLGWNVSGTELPGPAFRRAAARLPGCISSPTDFSHFPDASFDFISLWQVFEHLSRPNEMLNTVQRLLKPGGTLIVAVPNPASWQARLGGGDWLHLDPPRHLHLASPRQLASLLKKGGFEIVRRDNPWVEFGVVGVVQTAFNEFFLPRDEFLDCLRTGWRNVTKGKRLFYLASLACLLPPATAFAALETLWGCPATYELWAVQNSERP